MSKLIRQWISIGVLCILGVSWGLAQMPTGSIDGTVTDPSGASIPGAGATLTNQGTGKTASAVTSATGSFVFPSLTPGMYEVKIIAPPA